MVVLPCVYTLELRWDLDYSTTKLVDTDDSHSNCVRERGWIFIFCVWSYCHIKCASQLIIVRIFHFCQRTCHLILSSPSSLDTS